MLWCCGLAIVLLDCFAPTSAPALSSVQFSDRSSYRFHPQSVALNIQKLYFEIRLGTSGAEKPTKVESLHHETDFV